MPKPVRPKDYDRPGRRSQTAATVDLKAPTVAEFEHSTADYLAGLKVRGETMQ